jgi:hypothetical protein
VGPSREGYSRSKEVIIQFDQLLGDDTKPKTKANVYNVINFFSIVSFHGYFSSFILSI